MRFSSAPRRAAAEMQAEASGNDDRRTPDLDTAISDEDIGSGSLNWHADTRSTVSEKTDRLRTLDNGPNLTDFALAFTRLVVPSWSDHHACPHRPESTQMKN